MENSFKEFDSKIKSILDDAQEPVPPEVWGGISSKLGGDKILLTKVFYYGMSIAAVLLIVFLIGFNIYNKVNYDKQELADNEIINDYNNVSFKNNERKILINDNIPNVISKVRKISRKLTSKVNLNEKTNLKTVARSTDIHIGKDVIGNTLSEDLTKIDDVRSDEKTNHKDVRVPVQTVNQKSDSNQKSKVNSENLSTENWEDIEDNEIVNHNITFSLGGNIATNDNPIAGRGESRLYAAFNDMSNKAKVEQISKESIFSPPISLSIGIKIKLYKSFYLGTGITFSYLSRSYEGLYYNKFINIKSVLIHNSILYIGLPLNLYYNFIQNDRWVCYVNMGGMIERGVLNRDEVKSFSYIQNNNIEGLQYSLDFGLGVQFNLFNRLGIYVDPRLSYYFDNEQPISIRTQQHYLFNLELGVRFLF